MHRFSSFVKSPSSSSSSSKSPIIDDNDDNRSASTVIQVEPLPTPSLKIKRVDNYFSRWSKSWTYRVRLNRHVWHSQLTYIGRIRAPRIQLRAFLSCKAVIMMPGKTIALCKDPLFSVVEIVILSLSVLLRIVRVLNQVEGIEPTYKIVIKSGYIIKACKDVIQSWPGISWNSDPLEVYYNYI